jgi:hypothetical protein
MVSECMPLRHVISEGKARRLESRDLTSVEEVPTFLWILVPSLSGLRGTSSSRRLESSAAPLWETQNSHKVQFFCLLNSALNGSEWPPLLFGRLTSQERTKAVLDV